MDLNFTLSIEHVNAVITALGNAPYNVAAPVINEIQQQANNQMIAAARKDAADRDARERDLNPPHAGGAANGAMSEGHAAS